MLTTISVDELPYSERFKHFLILFIFYTEMTTKINH